MATWIAHLRVAERMLNKGLKLNKISFVCGNIGPDAGVPNEDWSVFNPPAAVTHWKDGEGNICAEDFYEKYIGNNFKEVDKDRLSFLIGYYTHLLTDIEWKRMGENQKNAPAFKEKLERDSKFIWTMKEDWYGLDFLYLKENKNNIFTECFMHITEAQDYLDYFPKGAFTNRIEYIRNYYLSEDIDPNRDYVYLTKEEMDNFIEEASKNIEKQLFEKGIFL